MPPALWQFSSWYTAQVKFFLFWGLVSSYFMSLDTMKLALKWEYFLFLMLIAGKFFVIMMSFHFR